MVFREGLRIQARIKDANIHWYSPFSPPEDGQTRSATLPWSRKRLWLSIFFLALPFSVFFFLFLFFFSAHNPKSRHNFEWSVTVHWKALSRLPLWPFCAHWSNIMRLIFNARVWIRFMLKTPVTTRQLVNCMISVPTVMIVFVLDC